MHLCVTWCVRGDIFWSKCQKKTRFCVRLVIKNGAFGLQTEKFLSIMASFFRVFVWRKDENLHDSAWGGLVEFLLFRRFFLFCVRAFSLELWTDQNHIGAWLEWIKKSIFFLFFLGWWLKRSCISVFPVLEFLFLVREDYLNLGSEIIRNYIILWMKNIMLLMIKKI